MNSRIEEVINQRFSALCCSKRKIQKVAQRMRFLEDRQS